MLSTSLADAVGIVSLCGYDTLPFTSSIAACTFVATSPLFVLSYDTLAATPFCTSMLIHSYVPGVDDSTHL